MTKLKKFKIQLATILVSASVILSLLSVTSCKKEPSYSCDTKINQWVITNHARVANYTREQLAAISSIDTQKAVYASLTPQAKYNIWMNKFALVKEKFILSDAEKQHLQKAMDYFNSDFWTSNETLDRFAPWMNQWGQDGINNLGWDTTKLFLIAESWLMPNELKVIADQKFTDKANGIASSGGGSSDCNCRYSISCRWFVQTCSGTCSGDIYSCGLASTSRCTGKCADAGLAEAPMTQSQIDKTLDSYLR